MNVRQHLLAGQVIPAASAGADTRRGRWTRRAQRALTRYYLAAGAGGIAVGVHTTQFAIRRVGMYHPVLQLAKETAAATLQANPRPFVTIAGVIGETAQAVSEGRDRAEPGLRRGAALAWRAGRSGTSAS